MDDFFQPYRITWIVIGFLLLLKGIIAIIYLFCCRNSNRRSTRSRNTAVLDTECGSSPMHSPYDPTMPGAPPSYEDLVKDGVLNPAYDREATCEGQQGGPSTPMHGPPVSAGADLPAPPPYSAAISQVDNQPTEVVTPEEQPPPQLPPSVPQPQDSDSQMPR